MNQYSYHLLLLVLTAVSAFSVCPCQAKTPLGSNTDQNNISPASSEVLTTTDTTDITKSSQVDNPASDTNSKQTILSETISDTSSASSTLATTNTNLRIPIFSRIFSVPSMRQ
ncbi:hypothetical protein [Dendronalium sp. ChiSLP03b]|uniref:hypothetical protein n=1 Tax=Dendronalium sp. ChiSLP03b TaxID=3075381 RepID=UPI002AD2BC7D|nr:hypothetical protein [Dendronalium sp. ChiSLP03b]MDZ8204772.1 hypothetical protein [Dendronalium sp. ChiSLP03b]